MRWVSKGPQVTQPLSLLGFVFHVVVSPICVVFPSFGVVEGLGLSAPRIAIANR